jgi:hypothetical protein
MGSIRRAAQGQRTLLPVTNVVPADIVAARHRQYTNYGGTVFVDGKPDSGLCSCHHGLPP